MSIKKIITSYLLRRINLYPNLKNRCHDEMSTGRYFIEQAIFRNFFFFCLKFIENVIRIYTRNYSYFCDRH